MAEPEVTSTDPNVEQLIKAITAKLEANAEILAKAKSGRLSWRWRQGVLTITLHPEL